MAIGHLNLFILLQTYTTTHIPSSYCRGLEYPLLKFMSLIMVKSIKLIHVPLVRSLNNCVILALGICIGILWNKDPFRFLLSVEIIKINMKEKIANNFFIKTIFWSFLSTITIRFDVNHPDMLHHPDFVYRILNNGMIFKFRVS